jgi:hypothetical protein
MGKKRIKVTFCTKMQEMCEVGVINVSEYSEELAVNLLGNRGEVRVEISTN